MKKLKFAALLLLPGVLLSCRSAKIAETPVLSMEMNRMASGEGIAVSADATEATDATEAVDVNNPIVEIDLSFLGDCTLATQQGWEAEGTFNWYANQNPKEYFFEKAYPFVYADDFTIANCENVFTDTYLPERNKGYTPAFWFRSKAANAGIFPAGSVEVVSLANNHTEDYGTQGMTDTIDAIERTGALEWGGSDKDVILEKNGVTIGLVCDTIWSNWDTQKILDRITALTKSTDIQVVYFHGGAESAHQAESWKIAACHQMVDAGADLVVGAHPHVLQPLEEYNGVNIMYSIGNFCFGGNRAPENRTVIYKETIVYDKDKNEIVSSEENIIPFYVYTGDVNNFQPAPILEEPIRQKVLDFVYQKSTALF